MFFKKSQSKLVLYFILCDDPFSEPIEIEKELSYSNLFLKNFRLDELLDILIHSDCVLRNVEPSTLHCFEYRISK